MFTSIKKIIEMNKVVGKITHEKDEDGLLVINLTVKDDTNFISPLSYGKLPTLSSEVADFLDESVTSIEYREKIHLKIHSDVIDENEKAIYENAIRIHYCEKYSIERQKISRDILLSVFMLLFGIAFLVVMVVLDKYSFSGIMVEVVDIIAWVFLWEATDIFFLQRKIMMWSQHQCIGFYKAKITFELLNFDSQLET